MNQIKIVTGSQASLSPELAEQFNVTVIPYYLNYPNSSIKEGVDIKTEDFYKTLEDIDSLPTSSPPSVGDIQAVLSSLSKENSEIIIFTLSAKYSQMYNSCQQAVQNGGHSNVYVVDSGGATAYQAMMVIMASKMAMEGHSVDSIMENISRFQNYSDEFLVFNTLKYLAKGGRIGKVQAFLGSVISIKPVIIHRDGISTPFTKVRTNKQALKEIITEMKRKISTTDTSIDVIVQGIGMDEWLEEVEKALYSEFNIRTLWRSRFSAITSIHTGPGAWSLCYTTL
ncbi:MAG: DegV family protein [Spirochaetota bacterium]|nr:DegV family protein [Spirochaetota bacterium]